MPVLQRRLLVVEDEPLLATLVAKALAESGFSVDIARDVPTARKAIARFDPDMVLLDIVLDDGPGGLHLAHMLHMTRPDIAILFLTGHPDAASARADGLSVPPGAGFLLKHMVNDTRYLLDAIETVFAEHAHEVAHEAARLPLDGLDEPATRVLRLLAEGCSNAEIARRCGLSVKSVERWLETVYRELGIDRRAEVNARVEAARRYYLAVGIPPTGAP